MTQPRYSCRSVASCLQGQHVLAAVVADLEDQRLRVRRALAAALAALVHLRMANYTEMLEMKRHFTESAETYGAGNAHGACAEGLMPSCVHWQNSGSQGQTNG